MKLPENPMERAAKGIVGSVIMFGESKIDFSTNYMVYEKEVIPPLIELMLKKEAKSVTRLVFPYLSLDDEMIKIICALPWLTNLDIQGNDITDTSVELIGSNLKQLRTLNISSCFEITNIKPLYKLDNLVRLSAYRTPISECDLEWVKKSKIASVSFSETEIKPKTLEQIYKILRAKNAESNK